jgi:hypothetical protein
MFAERLSQMPRVDQRLLDILVGRAFFKKQDTFAQRALPGISVLNSPRLVPKAALALGASD